MESWAADNPGNSAAAMQATMSVVLVVMIVIPFGYSMTAVNDRTIRSRAMQPALTGRRLERVRIVYYPSVLCCSVAHIAYVSIIETTGQPVQRNPGHEVPRGQNPPIWRRNE